MQVTILIRKRINLEKAVEQAGDNLTTVFEALEPELSHGQRRLVFEMIAKSISFDIQKNMVEHITGELNPFVCENVLKNCIEVCQNYLEFMHSGKTLTVLFKQCPGGTKGEIMEVLCKL